MQNVTIIGAGPGNPDLLSRAALDAINIADVVIGAHRALVGIDVPPDVVRCELVKTADIVAALTDAASWQRAVVVMTGDVGLFSGARRLVEALSGDAQVDVRVIPGISSASYLAARLARPWQDWRFVSAHGVACDIVAEAERAGELFLATSGGEDPSRLSGELVQAGFEADVTGYELLGSEVLLYFKVAGTSMTAKVDSRTTARMGDHIKLAIDPEKIHVFDKETELTITN